MKAFHRISAAALAAAAFGVIALTTAQTLDPLQLNPNELTINELLDRVLALAGVEADRVIYTPLPQDDPRRRQPDISRARALLGWSPAVSLEQGLAETHAWFRRELAIAPVAVA